MSLSDAISRRTTSRLLQGLSRYYVEQDNVRFASKLVEFLLNGTVGVDLQRYMTKLTIDRAELIESVPADRKWCIDSAETFNVNEPYHFDPLPTSFDEAIGTWHRDRSLVCELKDVELAGPTANRKTKDGKYILGSQVGGQGSLLRSILIERLSAPGTSSAPQVELDTALCLESIWSDNFFHWLYDLLPQLRALEEYEKNRGTEPKIVIGADPPGWKVKYLELLGYDIDDCVIHDCGVIAVSNLIVPVEKRYKPSSIRWVRERTRREVPRDSTNFPSKLYISRDDALSRRVLNEDQVMRALYKRGFAKIQLSQVPVDAQIPLFQQADTIVAPHGAGLASIMYCEDTSIVEIFGAKSHPCYFNISNIININYGCVFCENSGEDIIVDINTVERMLDLL